MKILKASVFVLFLLCSVVARADTPVIHITVGGEISPGVYGEVQFGNAPPPPVVYAKPMVIVQPRPNEDVRPLYLHVPPGHAKNWSHHCREYNACNRPVYFVRSAEYEPGYEGRKDKMRMDEGRRDEGRREEREDEGRREDRRGRGRDEERDHEERRGEGRY